MALGRMLEGSEYLRGGRERPRGAGAASARLGRIEEPGAERALDVLTHRQRKLDAPVVAQPRLSAAFFKSLSSHFERSRSVRANSPRAQAQSPFLLAQLARAARISAKQGSVLPRRCQQPSALPHRAIGLSVHCPKHTAQSPVCPARPNMAQAVGHTANRASEKGACEMFLP